MENKEDLDTDKINIIIEPSSEKYIEMTTMKNFSAFENIDIETSNVISAEPNNTFSDTQLSNNTDQVKNDEDKPNDKMPTCGTWFDECFNCCNKMSKCLSYCGFVYAIPIKTFRRIYFFILYLSTGELSKDAIYCMRCIKFKPASDENINITEIITTSASVVFELYKTLIGSFLIVFTSQRCGPRTCTIWENVIPKNDLEYVGIVSNFLMATALLIEYIFEILREAYLIKYLKHDKSLANNGEHIAELYDVADKIIFDKLIPLYIIYIRFSYVVLVIYIVNVLLSAVIVSANYYDNTSIFSFITNALFIIYKIYGVIEITSYRGNYFYSAYKKKHIHYNTIKQQYIKSGNKEQNKRLSEHKETETQTKENNNTGVVEIPSEKCECTEIIAAVERKSNEFIELSPHPKKVIDDILYIPEKSGDVISSLLNIDSGEYLNEIEKENILKELYEKNFIDKKIYYKIKLFAKKSKEEEKDIPV